MTWAIIVRHGQTEWNRVERFRGRADLALNETGHEQARRAALRIAAGYRDTPPITAIYSSPLRRARQTAAPLADAMGIAVQALEGLVDIDYGDWQGLTPAEVAAREPERYALWESAPGSVAVPGGERLAGVRARAGAAMQWALAQHEGGTVVLVTHKVVCKVLVCVALDITDDHFWQIEQDNCAVSVIEFGSGRPVLKVCNDTCHLE